MLQRTMPLVVNGENVRHAARTLNFDRATLKHFIDKENDASPGTTGYENCQRVDISFPSHMETELAKYIKQLTANYRGLSKEKCRTLIFEYAVRNGVEVPEKINLFHHCAQTSRVIMTWKKWRLWSTLLQLI